MALTNKLTSVANAIRSKSGKTATMTLDEMPTEIASLPTGITPTGKVNITSTSEVDVTNYATAQIVDENLTAENIAKDVTVLGIVGTHEGGSGGQQPTMNAPTIALSNKTLSMSNPSTNGNFFTSFGFYVNGELKVEQSSGMIADVSQYIDEDGTYQLTAKCKGNYFNDSEVSNTEEYVKTSGGVLSYYGVATQLSANRIKLSATIVGGYALFGGGYNGNSTNIVDAYDTELTLTIPSVLSHPKYNLSSTSIGNYALFGGGQSDGSTYRSNVDAYNEELTKTGISYGLSSIRGFLAASTVGNYALFGGGSNSRNTYSTIDTYDTELTRTTPTELSVAKKELSSTTVGNYALFGGGSASSGRSPIVDAYDTELTRTTPTELSEARTIPSATTVGNYALFGGGYDSSGRSKVVDAYDTELTRTIPTEISDKRMYISSTTVGNYALFGGGSASSGRSPIVDAYDTELTRTTPTELSVARQELSATTVGNYALFGGGYDSDGYSSVVDVYTVS